MKSSCLSSSYCLKAKSQQPARPVPNPSSSSQERSQPEEPEFYAKRRIHAFYFSVGVFLTIGQLAPFLCPLLSDNLRRFKKYSVHAVVSGPKNPAETTIGQLAPFGPELSDNLRRFYPQVSDNLRRLPPGGIGQLAPKVSDNLRRSALTIGQLAPKRGQNYRTTCAKLSDNLRRLTPKTPCGTHLGWALVVDNIYSFF